jgi:hypothetical protein
MKPARAEGGSGPTPFCDSGVRNISFALAHGPSLRFRPGSSVTLSGAVLWRTSFLYPLSPSPYDEGGASFQITGLWYSASVEWRAIAPVAVELGVDNDHFSVLPEATPASARLKAVFYVRLTVWPEAAVDFLSNPDPLAHLQKELPLAAPDVKTFYTPGPKGSRD